MQIGCLFIRFSCEVQPEQCVVLTTCYSAIQLETYTPRAACRLEVAVSWLTVPRLKPIYRIVAESGSHLHPDLPHAHSEVLHTTLGAIPTASSGDKLLQLA